MENDELHSIILINCGAPLFLEKTMFLDPIKRKMEIDFEEKMQEKRDKIIARRNRRKSNMNEMDDIDDMDNFGGGDDDEDIYDFGDELNIEVEEAKFEQDLNEAYANYQLPDPKKFQIYVFDNHRPFHLSNIASDYVSLLQNSNDTDISKYPIPNDFDNQNIENVQEMENLQYLNDSDDDDNDDENDDDSDNSDDEKQVCFYFYCFFFFVVVMFSCCF